MPIIYKPRHAKTPPTVFNPLSLWLTLPRDMGVSHTQWPPGITRATLACLWFAQGSKKSKQQSRSIMFRVIPCMSPLEKVPFATFYSRWKYLCGTYISKKTFSSGLMYSILSIDATYFFQHYLRSLSVKNANHLQTTDTLKRHQRYSIRYHCG